HTAHIVLGCIAHELSCVFDIPAHPGVGRHPVDHRKTGRYIRDDTALHELAKVTVRQPHQAEPRAALRRDLLGLIGSGPYPAATHGEDRKSVAACKAFAESFTEDFAS